MDIVTIHSVNESMLKTIQEGHEPRSSHPHESVARHYGISSVCLSLFVAAVIEDGELTWTEYGGTHPWLTGNTLAANLVCRLLHQEWCSGCPVHEPREYLLPLKLEDSSFTRGRLVSSADADVVLSQEWQCSIPAWERLPGRKRPRFWKEVMLHTESVDASLSYDFEGTAIGVYFLAGPDVGVVQYGIDECNWQTMSFFHHYRKSLRYPRTVMFAPGSNAGGTGWNFEHSRQSYQNGEMT